MAEGTKIKKVKIGNITYGIEADDLKARYHLGAFDTVSGNTITRQTGYVKISDFTISKISQNRFEMIPALSDSVSYQDSEVPYMVVNKTFTVVKANDVYYNSSNNIITINNTKFLLVFVSADYYTNHSADDFIADYGDIYIQYKLATSYTEKVIENQHLNTLDQSGSNWLRDEWKKGLNLCNFEKPYYYQGNAVGLSLENCEVGKTYTFKANTTVAEIKISYNWSGVEDVSVNTNVLTFTMTNAMVGHGIFVIYGGTNITLNQNYDYMLVEGDHAYPYQEYNGAIVHKKELGSYLPLSGGTMTGRLTMNGNRIQLGTIATTLLEARGTLESDTAITLPTYGGQPIVMQTAQGRTGDIGALWLTEDNAFICNSSDNGYTFCVFDTDLTTDFSESIKSSFGVRSNGEGIDFRGTMRKVDGSSTAYTYTFPDKSGTVAMTSDIPSASSMSSVGRYPGSGGASDTTSYVTPSVLYYWNGANTGTSSNLAYCNKGAFGTVVTYDYNLFVASKENKPADANKLTENGIYTGTPSTWNSNDPCPTYDWGSFLSFRNGNQQTQFYIRDGAEDGVWVRNNWNTSDTSGSAGTWRRLALSTDIPSGNMLWNNGSTTWVANNNITCSADSGEFSFDVTDNSSGNSDNVYWHVWSGNLNNSMLQCYPKSGTVNIPYTLTVAGNTVATQSWVQNQGYLTSHQSLDSCAKIRQGNDMIFSTNEISFVPSGYSDIVYVNYRTVGGSTNGNITDYYFCNGGGTILKKLSELAQLTLLWEGSTTSTITGLDTSYTLYFVVTYWGTYVLRKTNNYECRITAYSYTTNGEIDIQCLQMYISSSGSLSWYGYRVDITPNSISENSGNIQGIYAVYGLK